MWFGVYVTTLVEMVPTEVRSTCLSVAGFTVANIAGNLPVVVALLRRWLSGGLRGALMLMYPGGYLMSKITVMLLCMYARVRFVIVSFCLLLGRCCS